MAKKRYYGDQSNDVTDNMALKKGAQKAAMISEDYSAPGNLPQGVKMAMYPKKEYSSYSYNSYPDTLEGSDVIINQDHAGANRQRSNKKY